MDFNNEAREELLLALQTLEQSYNSLDIKYKNALKVQANYELLLSERVKELQCHSRLTEILGHSDYSLNESLSKIVKILPEAWQYPEIAEAMIQVGETNFATENYEITKWKQQIDILSHGEKTGMVSLGYLNDSRIDPNEPFLDEEYELLLSISGRLSNFIEKVRVINSLENSEIKYRNLIENIIDVVYEIDNNGVITYVSPSIEKLIGYTQQDLIGKPFLLFVGKNAEYLNQRFLVLTEKGEIENEYEVISKTGNTHWIRFSTKAMFEDGKFAGGYGTLADITERKQIELELESSEALYKSILNASPDVITIADLEGRIKFSSPKVIEMFGLKSPDDAIGSTFFDYISEQDYGRASENIAKMFRGEFPGAEEYIGLRSDGTHLDVEVNGEFIKDSNGVPTGLIFVTRDICERKIAEKRLQESEIRYKTFFNDNHSVMLLINPETGEITDANPAACRYYGWSHSEMCSMNISNINTLSMDELMVEMQRSINEDRNHFIFRHRIANGAIRDVEVYSGPIQFGNITMLYSIVHDITERLQAEAKIIKGSRLYAVISQINQAIVKCKDKSILLNEVCRISIEFGQFKMVWVGIVNLETNVVTPIITKGYEEGYLLNIKQISLSEDFEGSGPTGTALREGRYFVCNDIANDPHMILWKNEALQRGYHSSITLPLKQFGKVFAAFNLYSSTPHFFNDDEIKLLSEMAENISYALEAIDIERERLFVEEEKMKLSRAVEQSPVTIVITNIEGNIEYANTRACETTGYTLEELYGLNPRVLKSGKTSPEEYDVLWKTISEGNSWYGIFHNKRKTGELYWESTTISPITDINGNITNYLAIKEDITERKKSEQEIHELNENLELKITQRTEQLAETNISLVKEIEDRKKAEDEIMKARLESERANMAKSEFLSRMSHELRTPMNSILGFAQLLEMGDLNPGQKKGVNHIKRSGKHLLDLINEVLDISRIEAGHLSLSFEPVQIFGVIHEMVELVSEQAKKRQINIEFIESENNYLSLRSDKRRLKQIILNLLNNAIKYNKPGGTATIEVRLISQNKPNVTQVRISIKDTGQGIATENLHKLFNPFERIGAEKTDTEGTGLGLSVVKKLVDAMEGQIGVESEPGIGSTFWVDFPLSEDVRVRIRNKNIPGTLERNIENKSGTILYIEDNSSNIEIK